MAQDGRAERAAVLIRPAARSVAAGGGEIAGLHRKRPSGHGFERWLAWVREIEMGNASRGLCRASTSKARHSATARGCLAPVS